MARKPTHRVLKKTNVGARIPAWIEVYELKNHWSNGRVKYKKSSGTATGKWPMSSIDLTTLEPLGKGNDG